MYKQLVAMFCVILFITLPIAYADIVTSNVTFSNVEIPENYIGEEIIVNAMDYFPKVLKSSLIEEQDVNVQVLLGGVPTNPSITIPKIKNIHILSYNVTTGPLKNKGKSNISINISKPISSSSSSVKQVYIGTPRYYPPKGTPTYDNLGYLVIPIRRIPKEADVPDEINIEMVARIEFSVSEGLTFGEYQDVLQEQTETDWLKDKDSHKFFNGYIRASQVRDKDVTFVIYDDSLHQVNSVNVNAGSSSSSLKTYKTGGLSDIGNLGQLFSSYQIKVNEIRGTTNLVRASIFTGDKYIKTVLKEGSTLYSGSQWRVEKITILDKDGKKDITAELRNVNGEKSLLKFLGGGKTTLGYKETVNVNLAGTDKYKQIETKYQEAQGNYDDLVTNLKNIVATSNDNDEREIAKQFLLKIRDNYANKYKDINPSEYTKESYNIDDFSDLYLKVVSGSIGEGIEGKIEGVNRDLINTVTFIKINSKWSSVFGDQSKEITDSNSINTLDNLLQQKEIKQNEYSQEYLNKVTDIDDFLKKYEVSATTKKDSSGYYQNAITAYQKVKTLLLNAADPDDLKAKAQFEIGKIYKILNDNIRALAAYNDLITNYGNTNFVKTNQYMINNEINSLKSNVESDTIQLDDNGNMISVTIDSFDQKTDTGSRPKAYFEARDDKNLPEDVCKKVNSAEKNICEEGELINQDSSDWIWKVDTINGDNVIIKSFFKSTGQLGDTKTIKVGSSVSIQYGPSSKPVRLTLKKIDMKREAWISILPSEEKALSESTFNVHVPIEKRAIGLPLFSESLDEEINKTQDLVNKLDKIITNLEKVHNVWIKFCYATFAFVWAKNFLSGMFGSAGAARQKVMENWRSRYEQRGKDESKLSYEEYVFKHSDEVDKEVKDSEQIINSIKSKQYESSLSDKEKTLGDADKKDLYYYREMAKKNPDEYNVKKYLSEEVNTIKNKVDADISKNIKETTQWSNIDAKTQQEIINLCGGYNKGDYETELNKGNANSYFMQHRLDILDCYKKEKTKSEYNDYFKNWDKSLTNIGVSKNEKYDAYMTLMNLSVNPQISRTVSQIDTRNILKDKDGSYKFEGNILKDKSGNPIKTLNEGDKVFINNQEVTVSKSTEGVNYPYAKKVTLVQGGKNDGLVEMISIDTFRYAQVEYTTTGAIKNIDVYQRYNPNDKLGTGQRLGTLDDMIKEAKDDRVIEVLGQKVSTGKQSNVEIFKNVKTQINTLNKDVQYKKYSDGQKLKEYGVEKAAPKIQGPNCVDYMSPSDCKLLFNACDPVVCPASRCNAGGNWQVDNVVKTGIIGSIALCLPNMKQGIVMPVCLTGILAGLQNIKSILTGYAECLKVAKTSGESVGICDRVRNIYICDILWKEGLAIFNVQGGLLGIISKGMFGGQGGQEYGGGFKQSIDNSVGTIKYFTQNYAKGVFAAYSGGSLEEIGSKICESAIYAKVPGAGDFFSEITRPESPPQFLAFFDEQIYSDIKAGGESQYSVYYHIYAGENENIQYSVYLRARDLNGKDILSPVFVRKNNSPVHNMQLAKGGFADENIDFIAVSGYKEVCVEIRSNRYGVQTQCGFGKVTSDFGINYLNNIYISDQLNKQITKEEECVPETGRLTTLSNNQGLSYSDISLSQAAIGSFSTGLTQTGIIRKCSGYDPDITTNSISTQDNWRPVGTCGKDQYGRDLGICYLYVPGISSLITDAQMRDAALNTTKSAEEALAKQGLLDLQLYSDDQISNLMNEAQSLRDSGNYQGAVTDYENIVKYTLNENLAAKAQFEMGNTYKQWAENLIKKIYTAKKGEYADKKCKVDLNGDVCDYTKQYCVGENVKTSDEDNCCFGKCVVYTEGEIKSCADQNGEICDLSTKTCKAYIPKVSDTLGSEEVCCKKGECVIIEQETKKTCFGLGGKPCNLRTEECKDNKIVDSSDVLLNLGYVCCTSECINLKGDITKICSDQEGNICDIDKERCDGTTIKSLDTPSNIKKICCKGNCVKYSEQEVKARSIAENTLIKKEDKVSEETIPSYSFSCSKVSKCSDYNNQGIPIDYIKYECERDSCKVGLIKYCSYIGNLCVEISNNKIPDNSFTLSSIWKKNDNKYLTEDLQVTAIGAMSFAKGLVSDDKYYYDFDKGKWITITEKTTETTKESNLKCEDCNTKLLGVTVSGCNENDCLSGKYGNCYYGSMWYSIGDGCKSCDDIKTCQDYTTKVSSSYVEKECSEDSCKVGGSNGCYMTGGMCKTKSIQETKTEDYCNKLSYSDSINKYAKENNFDPLLIKALIMQESAYNKDACSKEESCGLMQLNINYFNSDATGIYYIKNVYDPDENIKVGINYLNYLYNRFSEIPSNNERIKFTLAAYNGGITYINKALELARNKEGKSITEEGKWQTWDYSKEFLKHKDNFIKTQGGVILRPDYNQIINYVNYVWSYYQDKQCSYYSKIKI